MRESEITELRFRSKNKYLIFLSYEILARELKPSKIL